MGRLLAHYMRMLRIWVNCTKCDTHQVKLTCRPVQLSYPVSLFAEAASELCHQPAVSAFQLLLAVFAASELPSAASAFQLLWAVFAASELPSAASASACQLLLAVSAGSACQLLLAVSAASACQLLLAVSAASACQLPLAVSAASGLALQILSSGLWCSSKQLLGRRKVKKRRRILQISTDFIVCVCVWGGGGGGGYVYALKSRENMLGNTLWTTQRTSIPLCCYLLHLMRRSRQLLPMAVPKTLWTTQRTSILPGYYSSCLIRNSQLLPMLVPLN